MNDPLKALREGLTRVLHAQSEEALIERWTKDNCKKMERTLQKIKKDHDEFDSQTSDPHEYWRVLHEFIKSGTFSTNRDLKTLCYGAHLKDPENEEKTLADEETAIKHLFEIVKSKRTTSMGKKCFLGLFCSYLLLKKASSRDQLRKFLSVEWHYWRNIPDLKKKKWTKDIQLHERILSDSPCRKYALELNQGKDANYVDALDRLHIPNDSWFIEETLVVRIQEATEQIDHDFKQQLPSLLRLITGEIGNKISDIVQKKCIATLVSRYAEMNNAQQMIHEGLRDSSIKVIGNPIDDKTSWGCWVQKNNKPDEDARKMIESWLKDQYILDFFSLLSSDPETDKNRLAYWRKKCKHIENVWFLIGNTELKNNPKYDSFFERIKGRNHQLSDNGNSAFIMKIGTYFVVEFGKTGNALYCYAEDNVPEKIKEIVRINKGIRRYSIHDIKNQAKKIDSLSHSGSWQEKFDDKLFHVFRSSATKRPPPYE